MARRARRYSPVARRKLIWARTELMNASAIPAAGIAIDLLSDFRSDGGSSLGATVTRVHITLGLTWTGVSPENRIVHGVLKDQLQANQAEIPRPVAEPHADWMHWNSQPQVPAGAVHASSDAFPATTVTFAQHYIDVKAQRKVEELGETLYYVIDPSYGAAGSVTMFGAASVLLRLP